MKLFSLQWLETPEIPRFDYRKGHTSRAQLEAYP